MAKKTNYLVLVLVGLTFWVFFGPQPLGGRAAYVTTRGNSMEPKYSEGDLVVVQKRDGYKIGDIVAYNSGTLHTIVLHRIVERDPRGFVTQGDNNGWVDPDRVRSAEVIGEAWFHIPGAGNVLAPLRNPVLAGALAALIGLSFLLGGRQMTRRQRERRRGDRKSGPVVNVPRIGLDSFSESQKRALLAIGGVAVVSVALLTVSAIRPAVKNVSSGSAYKHNGSFTYSADVEPNTVYPDGSVETGEPVFTRVVDQLKIGFDYRLQTEADASVRGYISLSARVVGQSGWTKPLLIADPAPFGGNAARAEGILDLTEVDRIARRVQRVTGIAEPARSIEVTPTVTIQGRLGGQDIAEDFAPGLPLTLDGLQLKVGADTAGTAALSVSQPGRVKASELAANNFGLFGLDLPHSALRTGSLIALFASILAAAALWRRFSNPAHADEPALIAAQYAEWLVPVETIRRDPQRSVHVRGFDALMRLAELYERMILHAVHDGEHTYFIEEEGVLYYYETSDATKAASIIAANPSGTSVPPPPPPPVPRRLKESQDSDRLRRLREELKQIDQQVQQSGPARPEE